MQRFIVYVYFIKFIGITHFVYSGILLLNSISFLGSITILVLNNFFIFVYTLLSNIYINLSLDSGDMEKLEVIHNFQYHSMVK
nr:MAG TPA_asm: hypothetical protein [Caudoviricetes sp.]